MAIKEHFEGKRDLGLIDPRKLSVDPGYNVRDLDKPEAREGLDYLKSLIRATGVQTPLRIREDGVREDGSANLLIVRGHRRHKVVMELIGEGHPIKLVPVTQEPRGTTDAERNWDLIDSNSEEPLKGFERAEALYKQINTFGWSEDEILKRTGKTLKWLNDQLALRTIDPEIKKMVDDKEVSLTTARTVTKENGAEAVSVLKTAKAKAHEVGKTRVTPRAVARVTGKSSKAKQTTDSLIDFVAVANKIEDEAKRAGGVENIAPDRMVALGRETIATLAKAKGQKPPEPTPQAQTELRVPAMSADDRADFQRSFEAASDGTSVLEPVKELSSGLPATQNQIPKSQGVRELIAALEPFAKRAEDFDPAEVSDDTPVEIPFRHLKAAAVLFAKVTGAAEDAA